MDKLYDIFLGEIPLGTTLLESADPGMGVVFGNINFNNIPHQYNFLKEYCIRHHIEFEDYPDVELISTMNIPDLKVFSRTGIEIRGVGINISGMESDEFEIYILGVTHPPYNEEFPHYL